MFCQGETLKILIKGIILKARRKKMEYKIYKKHGLAKVILIDPKNSNVEYLMDLGRQLYREHKAETFAFFYIFDNSKAADLFNDQKDGETMQDEDFYLKHFIALYTKNINSGLNRYMMMSPDEEIANIILEYK